MKLLKHIQLKMNLLLQLLLPMASTKKTNQVTVDSVQLIIIIDIVIINQRYIKKKLSLEKEKKLMKRIC